MSRETRERALFGADVYVILTRSLCMRHPLDVVKECVAAGVQMVQIREKSLGDGELLDWILEVMRWTEPAGTLVIVNDRPDLAVLAGADGAHVGADDLAPSAARALLGPERLLGVSTHGADDVRRATESEADHMGFGPMFNTATKGLEGLGLHRMSDAIGARKPVFFIGGIGPAEAQQLGARGASRIAVSSAVCGAAEPGLVVQALRDRLRGVV